MTEIRLRNGTGSDLDAVRLLPLEGPRRPTELGPLEAGGASRWLRVEPAYRYPAVAASGVSGELVHLPFAASHQQPLPPGRYTYVLRLHAGRLVVDLETDGEAAATDGEAAGPEPDPGQPAT